MHVSGMWPGTIFYNSCCQMLLTTIAVQHLNPKQNLQNTYRNTVRPASADVAHELWETIFKACFLLGIARAQFKHM